MAALMPASSSAVEAAVAALPTAKATQEAISSLIATSS